MKHQDLLELMAICVDRNLARLMMDGKMTVVTAAGEEKLVDIPPAMYTAVINRLKQCGVQVTGLSRDRRAEVIKAMRERGVEIKELPPVEDVD